MRLHTPHAGQRLGHAHYYVSVTVMCGVWREGRPRVFVCVFESLLSLRGPESCELRAEWLIIHAQKERIADMGRALSDGHAWALTFSKKKTSTRPFRTNVRVSR